VGIKGWSVVFEGERLRADVLAAILEADGLRVEVFGDNAYGIAIDLTPARILVPSEEAETARRLIKEAQDAPLTPDDEEEDV
jgi:putative signal transducing protein